MEIVLKNLPFFLPLLAGLVIYLVNHFWKDFDKNLFLYPALIAAVISILFFGQMLGDTGFAYFLGLPVSKFSMLLMLLVVCFSLVPAVQIYGLYRERDEQISKFLISLQIALFGSLIMLSNYNLIVTFMGMIVLSLGVLFAMMSSDKSKEISKTFYVITIFIEMLFLVGIAFVYGAIGNFNIGSIDQLIAIVNETHSANYLRIGIGFIFISLFSKIGIFPFHWFYRSCEKTLTLPLFGVLILFYRFALALLLIKMVFLLAPMWGVFLEIPVMIFAILTASYANIMALKENNLKRFLSYAIMVHLGYLLAIFPAMYVNGVYALDASLYFLISIFLPVAGLLILLQQIMKKDDLSFESLSGLSKTHSWFAAAITLFFASLAGLPLLAGFMARFLMFREMAITGNYILLIFVAINVVISLYVFTRPIRSIYSKAVEARKYDIDIAYPQLVSLLILVFLTIYMAVFFGQFQKIALSFL